MILELVLSSLAADKPRLFAARAQLMQVSRDWHDIIASAPRTVEVDRL